MKRHDEEFKKNAVRKLVMGDKPLTVLAKELGVSDVTLPVWRNRHLEEGDRHPRREGMPTPRELAKENRRLRSGIGSI